MSVTLTLKKNIKQNIAFKNLNLTIWNNSQITNELEFSISYNKCEFLSEDRL